MTGSPSLTLQVAMPFLCTLVHPVLEAGPLLMIGMLLAVMTEAEFG